MLSRMFGKTAVHGAFNKAILSLQHAGVSRKRACVRMRYGFNKVRVCIPLS